MIFTVFMLNVPEERLFYWKCNDIIESRIRLQMGMLRHCIFVGFLLNLVFSSHCYRSGRHFLDHDFQHDQNARLFETINKYFVLLSKT